MENIIEFIDHIDYTKVVLKCGEHICQGEKWNLEKHSHNVMELIYLIDAKAYIDTMDQKLYSEWCDLVIYPAYYEHQEYIDINASQKCMYIRVDVKSERPLTQPFKVKDLEGKLYWLLNEIIFLQTEDSTLENKELICIYMKAIFLNIKKSLTSYMKKQDIVMQAVAYINANYAEDITVDKLAKMFYVSSSYISRLFQKKMGITPMNYVTHVRIENAKKLLGFSKMSISEIASEVGIDDPKYFSRLFKKNTKQTPSVFKQMSSE